MSLSRRSFLSLPLAAGLTGHLRADGMEAPQASSEPLPAPIAALTSMKGRETPITADERRARVEKARRLIAEQRIDALMLCSGTSLVYFTNMRWSGAERLFAFVLPRTGEPFVVCPTFEEDRAREQIALGPFGGPKADVRTWQSMKARAAVAQGLRDRGVATGRLGVEETTKFVFSDGVAQAAPGEAGERNSDHGRLPRNEGCARACAHAARVRGDVEGVPTAFESLKEGMTQNDFARLVSAAHARRIFRRRRSSGRSVLGAAARVDPAASHQGGHDPSHRRRVQRRRV